MPTYPQLQSELKRAPRSWLVTGAGGFIGANLTEALLRLGQRVTGLDNFSTGHKRNLDEVKAALPREDWARFEFVPGDVCDVETCRQVCRGVDFVLHEAALGSVPRSIEDPLTSHASNVTGFLNLLVAVRDAKVKRFVYAASSSVYGDNPDLPKVETSTGRLLSPYAATKYFNEIYADVFGRCYGVESVGLRYFNVFGPRQDPEGAYAAVIPRWIAAMIRGEAVEINGDGETSRDFCFIDNVTQANLLAATTTDAMAVNQVFNVACGTRTTLNQLFEFLRERLAARHAHLQGLKPVYRPFREGDVRHSEADISKAAALLGYAPTHTVAQGLDTALEWYLRDLSRPESQTPAPAARPASSPAIKP